MKKVLGVVICLFLICGCATSHLENGEESVVKFSKGGVSAEDLYEKLKKENGLDALITLLDTELLDEEYNKSTEETNYIKDVVNSLKNEWKDDFEKNITTYYGVSSEKDFKEYIRLNYRRNLWKKDYAESLVTDKQVEEYYEEYAIGDIEASHILIKSNATSSMSDKEKTEVENKALETAKEVIKKLNDGEKFEDLAKEYSNDDANKDKGGVLDKFNDRSNFDENFLDAAIELEVGKYSSEPVKSQFGYHIIYKTKQDKKPELKDIKESIVSKIAEDIIAADSNFSTKSILALREKYGVKIKDSDLKKEYNKLYGLD